jgi:hypothetical protein
MRVLHLTTEFPWPATSGGPVRTLSQLRITASLPEVEAITLLSVTERPVPEAEIRALASSFSGAGVEAGEKVRIVPPIFHPIHLFDFKRYVPRVALLRLGGVPYLAGKWDSTALRRRLRRELRDAAPTSSTSITSAWRVTFARSSPNALAAGPSSTSTTWRATSSSSSQTRRRG